MANMNSIPMIRIWDYNKADLNYEHDRNDCNVIDDCQDEMEEGAQDGEHERDADAPDAPRPCLRTPSAPPGLLHLSHLGTIRTHILG